MVGDEDEIWYQYCLFKLRDLDYVTAEEALWKAISCSGAKMPKFTGSRDYFAHPKTSEVDEDELEKTDPFQKRDIPEHIQKYKTLLVCFYLYRGKVDLAKNLILHLLSYDRLSTLHNTFLSFIYIQYEKNHKLGRKYNNVSQRVTMKNLGYIKSNEKNRYLPKKKKQRNRVLEKLPELSESEKDEIWMELIAFLSNNYMIELTNKAVTMLTDQNTYRVNLIHSSLAFLQKDFSKSDQWLDTILENNNSAKFDAEDQENTKKNSVTSKQVGDILLRKSFNSFMNQRFYEAEEFIFSAIKNDPKLTDFSVLLRLGFIYLKRESIEDAYTVLSKACSVNSKSALVWMGLAVAALSLDRLEEAESSLRMANVLDPINSEVWGYSILLALKDDRKIDQSLTMLEKYLNLPIENLEVLNTIGEVLMNLDYDIQAYSVFYRLLQLHGDSQEVISNLGFDLENINPTNVRSVPISVTNEGSDFSPINPKLNNNLKKFASKDETSVEENDQNNEISAVSLTPKELAVQTKNNLLIKPIFLQENCPHTPNITLPKVYWIMGQLLHKF
jgi:tetratricopeptide (TPR) repeat protein